MKYLLFLNHPKGEKVYKVSKSKEKIAKKYFNSVNTFKTTISLRGEKIEALVDYNIFNKPANFDCFNCQDPCCGDNPVIYETKTRDFLVENFGEYNSLTKNGSILEEFGLEEEEIIDCIKTEEGLVPDDFIDNEIQMCSCSYKPNNCSTLCSIHSIALSKELSFKEIVELKPLVCSLWPLEILVEDDMSLAYITLPDDFTNNFISEDYYKIACINLDYSASALFRRENPEGFSENGYKPFYIAYKDTLIYGLGSEFYESLLKNLEEDTEKNA